MEHAILQTADRKALAVLFTAITLLAAAPDANAAKYRRAYSPYQLPPIIMPSTFRSRPNTNTPPPRIVPLAPPRMTLPAVPPTTPTTVPPKAPAGTPATVPVVAAAAPTTATITVAPQAPLPAASAATPAPTAAPHQAAAIVPTAPVIADTAPQISGAPRTAVKVGDEYSFGPAATDVNGHKLTFEIANKPSWLNFSATTGTLLGTPTAAQVGTYRNVTIQVAANGKYATLPSFDIEVMSVGQRGVTLSWAPPTRNDDGSALTNLAGYRIRYGAKPGAYTTTININGPGVAAHFVEGLVPGTYYFVISAYNTAGTESNFSNEAAKTL